MASPVAAVVTSAGISAPNYAAILAYLQQQYQGIFGADVYLGNDSQDGQFLGIIASAINDVNAAAVAVYNAFSPSTAQGAGLSSVVKINGIERLVPAYSTAQVTIVGIPEFTVTNGQCVDVNNNVWALPPSVTFPAGGSMVVTATCTTLGAIAAAAGAINAIQTPMYGWTSVTNAAAATPGAPVETDGALRVRQGSSVELPSQTIFEGIVAAIQNITGVTRAQGYENNTNAADSNGIPAGNLAFIVEGGAQASILGAIASKIAPGTPTYGTTSATVIDAKGSSRLLSYSISAASSIGVAITIKQLTGWTPEIETAISTAIVNYLMALPIGAIVSYTELFVPAYSALAQYPGTYRITAMTINSNGGAFGTTDIAIPYNGAATCAAGNIAFTLT